MIATPAAASLDLDAAAEFVGLHPDTLRERAASGIIPGCKIGKEWRFLDVDLIGYMRGQYRREPQCRSSSADASGGSTYGTAEDELDARLAQATRTRPSASTTSLRLACGNHGRKAGR